MWLRYIQRSVQLFTALTVSSLVTPMVWSANGTIKEKRQDSKKMIQNAESKMTKYNLPFGTQETVDNTTFTLADFRLTFVRKVELTNEERKRREAAQSKGVDGGDSMVSPSHHFKIETLFGELIGEYDLRQVPYHHIHFTANNMKFQLSNSTSRNGRWIVETL